MNEKKKLPQIRILGVDFQHFWKYLISYYRLPFTWDSNTWAYVATGIVLFPGLFFVDPYIRVAFSQMHNQYLDSLFSFAHWYGKIHLTLDSFIVIYVLGLVLRHEELRRAGWKIFEAFAISGITVTILKSLFGRWRPYTGHGSFAFVGVTFGPNAHLSLPSGDVGVAVAYSMILAGFSANRYWKSVWYLLALLTSLSRIYYDQHWFSDVTLAAIISVSVGNYVNAVFKKERAAQPVAGQ